MPPFQRPPVWSIEQSEKFLESCVLGYHLEFYVYNQKIQKQDIAEADNVDMWLTDGQQRLRAIKLLFDDKISVFGTKFSEVDKARRKSLMQTPLGCYQMSTNDKSELLEMYTTMNFSGTAHTLKDHPNNMKLNFKN